MTLTTLEQRLCRIEKARHANRFARLSEDQLQAMIDEDLTILCRGYPSVNALADDLRISSDPLDREVAEGLGRYIADHLEKLRHAEWVERQRTAVQ